MKSYQLPFATINIVQTDIAEVIVNEGTEMTLDMVNQYHDFLLAHLQAPFSILVNKLHSYTYDFKAQENLATLTEINAIAVVVYNQMARLTTDNLANFPRSTQWNMRIFYDKEDALEWLNAEQNKIPEQRE